MYNIENLPKRLDKLKADPWADFFTTRQSITQKIKAAFERRFERARITFNLLLSIAHSKIADAVPSIVGSFVE